MGGKELDKKKDELIRWKTDAWKDPGMVAWYSRRMVDNSGTMRLHNQLETGLFEQFVAGERVLDVGVGTGRASIPLARKGLRVTGVDSSQAMLDECRRLLGNTPMELRQGDVLDLPVEDEQFDTVMALNVMTHFPHWQEVLGEWNKKARPGGRIIFDIYSLDHLSHVRGQPVTPDQILREKDFADFSMHVGVEEVAACADRLGLRIAAIVPYAGLYSGKYPWRASGQPLSSLHWWNRLLSWIAVDDAFLAFALFLEREFFLRLSSRVTGRFAVVLEKTPDADANRLWLERNRALNTMLETRVDLAGLAPYLAMDANEWRTTLNRHLDHPRHLACFYQVWTSFWQRPESVDLDSLVDARHQRVLEGWLGRERADERAFSFARSWHLAPEIAPVLMHGNVNLGEGLAYEMTRTMLRDGFKMFSGVQA